MAKLNGKVAVVTGASKGIGAEIARQLAAAGAAVAVNYASSKSGAEQIVDDITAAGGKAIAIQGNVAEQSDVSRLFAETLQAFGRIDILVNNAGIYEFAALGEIDNSHYRRLFDVNVLGVLLTTQEAVKHFGSEGGAVINISSIVATLAPPQTAVYSATKAAVDAITRSLAKELGPRKIRVNSVNPGMVETEGTHAVGLIDSEMHRHTEATTPLGRIGRPDDIAPVVVFLASDDSRWMTGETLYASGGML